MRRALAAICALVLSRLTIANEAQLFAAFSVPLAFSLKSRRRTRWRQVRCASVDVSGEIYASPGDAVTGRVMVSYGSAGRTA